MHENHWIRSRFNAVSTTETGELLLYNSYTGSIAAFTQDERHEVMQALSRDGVIGEPTELQQQLIDMNFLIPAHADEERRAQFLYQSIHRTDFLHLAILSTEACNFRCTYCYEDYAKGDMSTETIQAIKKYVAAQAPILRHLSVSWFGGEPLVAAHVIEELSAFFLEICAQYGIKYDAEILTNGYLLDDALFAKTINWQIKRYMITIDGPERIHDTRRHLTDGGGTFQTILHNLLAMKETAFDFEVFLRTNFDNDNVSVLTEWIAQLGERFGHDRRFQTYFRPVGRMGGHNDANLPICDAHIIDEKIWEFTDLAIDHGVGVSSLVENALMPFGSTCYAVKPNSFVIGSDGMLYKCSVAFHEPVNQVGKLLDDGTLELDYDKLAYWVTTGDEQDETCRSCFFRPACNGSHCKLYRMRNGERPCSFEKRQIKRVLQTIYKHHTSIPEARR